MTYTIPTPPEAAGAALADWAEAWALVEGRATLSRSQLRDRISSRLELDEDDVETALDLLLDEVARRRRIGGSVYPFDEVDGLQRRHDVDPTVCQFLLLLAISPRYRDAKDYDVPDLGFDLLVQRGLARFLGERGRAVRFAFPSSDGRPPGFPDAIGWLAALLNLSRGTLTPRPKLKDGGVDVVAWRHFLDGRTGFLVILAQATVQQEWTPKGRDIVDDNWRAWIDLGKDPITALAVPFAIPRQFDRWEELRRTTHLVFDRIRLCELLVPDDADADGIREWTQSETDNLAA